MEACDAAFRMSLTETPTHSCSCAISRSRWAWKFVMQLLAWVQREQKSNVDQKKKSSLASASQYAYNF